jgi:hypothetical protein
MFGIFADLFAGRGMMRFMERNLQKQQMTGLMAGLNLLKARVRIQNTRSFNRFCVDHDLTREEAAQLMLGTLNHFKEQVKGEEKQWQNGKTS